MKETKQSPPKIFLRFFRWYCDAKILDYIEGDLVQVYRSRRTALGKRKADLKFIIDVLLLFRPGIIGKKENDMNFNNLNMYRSYLMLAWRNLLRNKANSSINIGGLALAFACAIVIILYAENEFSFDKFHRDSDNIYRVVKDFVNEDGTKVPDATTPPALAPALRDELPEVETSTRLSPNFGRLYLLEHGDKRFYETKLIRVDSNFFKVFDFSFIAGDKHSALREKHSIILTETTAKKYFGEQDPMNKLIRINLNNGTDFVVSAILRDVPQNSHFTFDLLIPFESRMNPDTDWERSGFYTYVRLKTGSIPQVFQSNVKAIIKKNKPNSTDQYYIQRLTDIHLTSSLKWELSENGDLLNVQIMLTIGVFVIVIASINYVNVVTAQSSKRAKEVGVRKVSGASKKHLISQFLTESVLTAFASLAISVILTISFLPLTETLFGYDLSSLLYQSNYITFVPIFALLIGVFAGLYPGFYLSTFEPLIGLKGNFLKSHRGARLRQGLVVFQFVVSSSLIMGTLIIIKQLDFMKLKKLGFNKDNVILLPNVRGGIGRAVSDPAPMLEELKAIPGITDIARADGVLGLNNSVNGIAAKYNDQHIVLNFIRADYDYLPTMEIKIKEGRNFSDQFKSDTTSIIINEAAVEQLGLKRPYIGQQLVWDDEAGKTHDVNIIGVIENFHFTSFRETIKPFGFILEVGNGSTFFLKTQSRNLDQTIASIQNIWIKHNPEKPFEYAFQDQHYAKLHVSEARFQNLFFLFTMLAILITCLGIFGLITYIAGSKVKEIGIRKVLGASVNSIVVLLTSDFLRMLIISFMVSLPFSYYVMEKWLQGFAYRSEIGWKIFLTTILASVVILFVTVSFQAIKAALTNPVKSLKSE